MKMIKRYGQKLLSKSIYKKTMRLWIRGPRRIFSYIINKIYTLLIVSHMVPQVNRQIDLLSSVETIKEANSMYNLYSPYYKRDLLFGLFDCSPTIKVVLARGEGDCGWKAEVARYILTAFRANTKGNNWRDVSIPVVAPVYSMMLPKLGLFRSIKYSHIMCWLPNNVTGQVLVAGSENITLLKGSVDTVKKIYLNMIPVKLVAEKSLTIDDIIIEEIPIWTIK